MNTRQPYALRSRRTLVCGAERALTLVVNEGRIQQLLDYRADVDMPLEDIGDKVLMPGLVDTHVHINEPGRTEWEGFNTATRAAAAGGITSVVDMPLNCTPVTTTAAALQRKLEALAGQLWVDCGFWGGVVPGNLDALEGLIDAGVLGAKSFMIHSGINDFPQVDESHMRRAIAILARHQLPYLIHAELDREGVAPAAIGTSYQNFLHSRPRRWENQAIELMISLAAEASQAGCTARLHIVHLSSADAIASIAQARADGLAITAETCPHYLTLFAEACADGETLLKCCPPIREDENRVALWRGLVAGGIDFVVSDHSPCTPRLKHLDDGDLGKAWGGISSLQFGLSLVWTEAGKRGIPLTRVVDWMASRPAEFAGLGARKGRIEVGYDADLLVFDDAAEYEITSDIIRYRHKITPYVGRRVRGRVEKTLLRGALVFDAGEMLGAPTGRPLLRHTL